MEFRVGQAAVERVLTRTSIDLTFVVKFAPDDLGMWILGAKSQNWLYMARVTEHCEYSFERPLPVKRRQSKPGDQLERYPLEDECGNLWAVRDLTDMLDDSKCKKTLEELDRMEISPVPTLVDYYPIRGNQLAQPLGVNSCAPLWGGTADSHNMVGILQLGCCLECTVKQAKLVAPFQGQALMCLVVAWGGFLGRSHERGGAVIGTTNLDTATIYMVVDEIS